MCLCDPAHIIPRIMVQITNRKVIAWMLSEATVDRNIVCRIIMTRACRLNVVMAAGIANLLFGVSLVLMLECLLSNLG